MPVRVNISAVIPVDSALLNTPKSFQLIRSYLKLQQSFQFNTFLAQDPKIIPIDAGFTQDRAKSIN